MSSKSRHPLKKINARATKVTMPYVATPSPITITITTKKMTLIYKLQSNIWLNSQSYENTTEVLKSNQQNSHENVYKCQQTKILNHVNQYYLGCTKVILISKLTATTGINNTAFTKSILFDQDVFTHSSATTSSRFIQCKNKTHSPLVSFLPMLNTYLSWDA